MRTFTHTFQISEEAYQLLLSIKKDRFAEYRDTHFNTLEDFMNGGMRQEWQTESYFMSRNYNGTYYLIDELLKYNLVDHVEDCWHQTFELTNFGQEMVSQANLRDQKINEIIG